MGPKLKIAIHNNRKPNTLKAVNYLRSGLQKSGFRFDNRHPDIVITVGGDGTLLSAFHRYAAQLDHVRFVGVHTGHLGFYTDWRDYELDHLIDALKVDSGQSVAYPLLDVTTTYKNSREQAHFLCLNESTIKRLGSTLRANVYIQDSFFESFRGDGLCVSTPTGSTAYSKSLGGAVLHPRLEALQITEIASINNRVYRTLSAPVVVASDENIVFKPSPADDYVLTVDQLTLNHRPIEKLEYRIAKERIHFARYRHMHFWDRVEEAFIGANSHEELS
ncbi:NAD kinase [Agrilactobacillus fermenti]|uniref:NAD kinase n=1 Tax=Agrilactobacillus fermenti TaxID=2586909 RepID=UPI001E3C6717|nr:NAD kinase [Agrilactobacillus fermenti]MCD2255455.1 NAD kinase [Agrilactobacillus fermenti]